MVDGKTVLSVEIDSIGRESVDAMCTRTGIKKRLIVGRILTWVANQDVGFQAVILGQVPAVDGAAILRRLADDLCPPVKAKRRA